MDYDGDIAQRKTHCTHDPAKQRNAFNDVFFNNPNLSPTSADFGKVSSQNTLPRNIQIGTRVLF